MVAEQRGFLSTTYGELTSLLQSPRGPAMAQFVGMFQGEQVPPPLPMPGTVAQQMASVDSSAQQNGASTPISRDLSPAGSATATMVM